MAVAVWLWHPPDISEYPEQQVLDHFLTALRSQPEARCRLMLFSWPPLTSRLCSQLLNGYFGEMTDKYFGNISEPVAL